jgi:hypothetical protein
MLEHADRPLAADRRGEVLRIVIANQRGQVRGEVSNLDFRVRRPIASDEIEEERDADVVDILEARGINPDWTLGVTG